MKQWLGRCNLETIFQVRAVPSDTQMRTILDEAAPDPVRRQWAGLFEDLRRAGWAEPYRTSVPDGRDAGSYYTCVLDGGQYFNSTNVQCPRCLTKTNKKTGTVQYAHSVVSGTLVKAGTQRIYSARCRGALPAGWGRIARSMRPSGCCHACGANSRT